MSDLPEAAGSFAFFASYWRTIKKMPDAEKLAAFVALCEYAFEGVEPSGLPLTADIFFEASRVNLENSMKKSAAGKAGGRPSRFEAKSNLLKSKNKSALKQEDRIGKERIEKDRRGEESTDALAVPSLSDVITFASERGLSEDPEHFFNYYSSRDWCFSDGSPVRDWQALFMSWETNKYSKEETINVGKSESVWAGLDVQRIE